MAVIMGGHKTSRERWNKTLELNVKTLGKHYSMVNDLDYDTFDLYLRDLILQHESKKTSRFIAFTSQSLEPLRQFTGAITAVCQTTSMSNFVWGALQVVIKLAGAFSNALDDISGKLCELVRTLPVLEEYRTLFPDAYELDEPLRELYQDFVTFCINSIMFLKSPKWKVLGMLAWGQVEKAFDNTARLIALHKTDFMDRLNLARTRLGVAADRHIQSLTAEMMNKKTITIGIPFAQNARFQGRSQYLNNLHQCLKPRGADNVKRLQSCVIHGMAGIGKTQTALEYTYRYREDYSYILWIRAESVPEIVNSFEKIARQVLPQSENQNQIQTVERVLKWLEKFESWLLVFDNLDDVHISPYWPSTVHGSVIVTTQRRILVHQAVHAIELETFGEEEGSKLILDLIHSASDNKVKEDNIVAARKLSNELGGLPLLLSHVAGYADSSNFSPSQLLDMLASPSSFTELYMYDSTISTNFQYSDPMKKVWSLALQALRPEALDTLHIISMLSPDNIAEDMLIGDWEDPGLEFLKPAMRVKFSGIRGSLRDRHLININNIEKASVLSIHRALARHILNLMEDAPHTEKLDTVFQRALTIVRQSFPLGSEVQGPTNHTWKNCEQYLPHVLSLLTLYQTRRPKIRPSQVLANLVCDAANYLWERGLIKDAINTLEIGENVCNSVVAVDDSVVPIYANICAISGAVHAEVGFSGRVLAMEKCEKALELRKIRIQSLEVEGRVTLVDAMLLANGYNDFGVVKMQNEEFDIALDCHLESLKLKNQWASEETYPVQFGESYKNLCIARLSEGKVHEAVSLATRSLELHRKGMDEMTVSYQKAKFTLACVLFHAGEREKSLRMNKEVMKARVQIVGESHALAKDSMYMIGEIYRLLGEYEKAEKYFRRSLKDAETAQVPEDCIARAKFHLALAISENSEQCTGERLDEVTRLKRDAESFRAKYAGVIPVAFKMENEIRLHDFMVSLWSGRTTGLLGSTSSEHE